MEFPIIVGKIKEDSVPGKKPKKWKYTDIEYNADGWADTDYFLPHEFDLCLLITDDERLLKGWHTGQIWDGIKVTHKHNIKLWKQLP